MKQPDSGRARLAPWQCSTRRLPPAAAAAASVLPDRSAQAPPCHAGVLLVTLAAAQKCRHQLLQAVPSAAGVEQWIDAATPDEACLKQLDGFDAAYQLVFSDEFNSAGRSFR